MLTKYLVAVMGLLSIVLCSSAHAQGNYLVNPGDSLRVEVLEDSGLNRNLLVLPDGKISFPMAGTVVAAGRTVEQIERAISSQLESNFTTRPTVNVAVIGLRESAPVQATAEVTVYVLGEVNTPGPKAIEPNTTVLQLLSQSGGFTKFAATKRLQLRRKDPKSGREKVFKINYKAISRGVSLQSDLVLQNGDVLLVPERRLFE